MFLEDLSGADSGKTRLIAMDHTHCFTCGRDLDDKLVHIGRVKDDRLYGLFPGFRSLVRQADVEAAIDRLRELEVEVVRPIVDTIPDEWKVDVKAKDSLVQFVVRRAEFAAETILDTIAKECWPDQLFDTR